MHTMCYKRVWRTKTNTAILRYQKHARGVQTATLDIAYNPPNNFIKSIVLIIIQWKVS